MMQKTIEIQESQEAKTILCVGLDASVAAQVGKILNATTTPFSLDKPLPQEGVIGAILVDSKALQLEDHVIRRLRSRYPDSAIFLLCEKPDRNRILNEWIDGLDDFLLAPLNPDELKLRYDIHSRRHLPQNTKKSVRIEDLYINQLNRSVESGLGKRKLSRTEFSILMALAQNYGSMVPKKDIKKQCWGTQAVSDNALNRKIHDVRKVLVDIGSDIELKSVYGKGLILQSNRGA